MRRRGFTYSELLMVLVLCVLSGPMLRLVWRQWRYRGRSAACPARCKSNLKQIGLAGAMYANDYAEWWPTTGGGKPDGTQSLALLYDNYLSSINVFRCPTSENNPSYVLGPPADLRSVSYQYDGFTDHRADPMKAMGADFGDSRGLRIGPAGNHENGTNVFYYDGHVEWQFSTMNWYTGDQTIYGPRDWDAWSYSYLRR